MKGWIDSMWFKKNTKEPKFCIDCKYFLGDTEDLEWGLECKHPLSTKINIITRKITHELCFAVRLSGHCGKSGNNFEEK